VMKGVTSAKVVGDRLYVAMGSDGENGRIIELRNGCMRDVVSLPNVPCNILLGLRNNMLVVSAGNTLYIMSSNGAKPVLRARHGNWFLARC
jgi:hypothetical protein